MISTTHLNKAQHHKRRYNATREKDDLKAAETELLACIESLKNAAEEQPEQKRMLEWFLHGQEEELVRLKASIIADSWPGGGAIDTEDSGETTDEGAPSPEDDENAPDEGSSEGDEPEEGSLDEPEEDDALKVEPDEMDLEDSEEPADEDDEALEASSEEQVPEDDGEDPETGTDEAVEEDDLEEPDDDVGFEGLVDDDVDEGYCFSCGVRLDDRYFIFTTRSGETRNYCKECRSNERCSACSLPLRNRELERGNIIIKLPDGRQICGHCRPHVIITTKRGKKLALEKVVPQLREMGIVLKRVPPIIVVHKNWDTSMVGYTWPGGDVCIIDGLEEKRFLRVTAHELTHVWTFENDCICSNNPCPYEEGFCEWVAYHFCESFNSTEQMQELMEHMLEQAYGPFFRKYVTIEEESGAEGCFRTVMTHRRSSR